MKKQIVCSLAIIGLAIGCATKEEQYAGSGSAPDLGTKFTELPAAVQATIKSHAPDAQIDDIDKETRSGQVVYEITFSEPGSNPKMHVAADGTLVKSEPLIEEKSGAESDSSSDVQE
jgi:hypothetical protein